MVNFIEFFSEAIAKNTTNEYLYALCVFIVLFAIFKIFDIYIVKILKRFSEKTKVTWDDFVIGFIDGIGTLFYVYLAFYFATLSLSLPDIINKILWILLIIIIGYYAARGVTSIIDHLIEKRIKKKEEKNNLENASMLRVLGLFVKIAVWVVLFLMILSNLGIEITPLIAGLGIGGIAIALALQNILSDLFSAMAIYFDKPFKEGDFIIIGEDMGVVKHVGIKSTRIQSLQGQELVISNSELIKSRINNYGKMHKRRVLFNFGVEYSTANKKLEKIKSIVKKIIEDIKDIDIDRVNFKKFGDSSLDFEVVYFIHTGDYNKFMDIQEQVNLKIKDAFEKEKINFAFPSRTIYMDK